MRDYIKLAGILFLVCAVAAILLGYTNTITYDKIQVQIVKANDEARKTVMPDADQFEKLEDSTFSDIKAAGKYDTISEIYLAKAAGNVVGYTVKTGPKGYGGTVDVVVGISMDGVITGVKVGDNLETPGLGKNAETPKFQEQFKEKSWASPVNVIKSGTPKDNEIAALSGATITSKAVALGVNQALEAAKELSKK